MASEDQKRIIQLTGFKKQEKRELLEWLFRLDCVYLDNKQYRNCTHLIAKKLCKSEKFLAACAAGKWILTKEYIINSAESGRWLDETTYEWGYEIERDTPYSPQMQSAPKRWRKELARSRAPGAFHRWKVILPVTESDKRMASIRRVLQAGKATICSSQNAEHNITHIFIRDGIFPAQNKKHLPEPPYYPLQYLGDYIFETVILENEELPKIFLDFLNVRHVPTLPKAESCGSFDETESEESSKLSHQPVLLFLRDPYVLPKANDDFPNVVIEGILHGIFYPHLLPR